MSAASLGTGMPAATPAVKPADPNFSLTDLSRFDAAAARAGGQAPAAQPPASAASSPTMKQLMKPFEHLSAEASQMQAKAGALSAKGSTLTPGEMIMLTVRCQEFMFHCQLTSNVANRTSDGLQQLVRQQG